MTDGVTEAAAEDVPRPARSEHGRTEIPADVESVRPRVVSFTSGNLGMELTAALRRFGAQVITIDAAMSEPDQPADPDTLLQTLQELQPDFVVTLADSFPPELPAVLETFDADESQEAEVVPCPRAVRLTADREGLRRLAADELGLPTAPFWFVESLAELEAVAAHAGFPLLVKSADGAGRSVVRGPDEVARAWERISTGWGSRVWAETVVDIEFLVTLIVVRSEGPSGPVIEFCAPIGHSGDETGALDSWQPQEMTTAASDAAKSIAARVVKALGGRGIFSVELMINGDEVYFADVTAGARDTAWVTLRTQRLSAFELQARAILGLAVDTMMVSPGAAALVDPGAATPVRPPDGNALAAALDVPESDVRVFGHGAVLGLATAPDVATARDRARQVATALNVRDSGK